jgi:hypothetical protein
MGQLEDNLGATTVELDANDHERLDARAEPELAIVPYYRGNMSDFRPSTQAWL